MQNLIRLMLAVVLLAGSFLPAGAQAFCFQNAGARYHIDPQLLLAIAEVESHMDPGAIGKNRNKRGVVTSRDYGLMQINSAHVQELQAMGLIHDARDLLANSCLNVQVGAWILARTLKKCGVSWSCLGSYNAGFNDDAVQEARRLAYARKVYARYLQLRRI